MSEEKKEAKVECPCGSTVFVKNMSAHQKTKKHLSSVGGQLPPKPTRTKGVDFSLAQKQREEEDDDEDELDDEGFEDDVLEALEDIEKNLADLHSVVCELKNSLIIQHNLLTSCVEEMKAMLTNKTPSTNERNER